MISKNLRLGLNEALRLIAKELDLDKTRYENASQKYQAVADWLSVERSLLDKYNPDIYPQGSFMLGTVVKPKTSEEYDLDFVCELTGFSGDPKEIKKILGDRLKENERYHSPVLEEKNRCWRINYVGEFHMDILPGRPLGQNGINGSAIEVPDKELDDWKISDPKGYGRWFEGRMKEAYERKLQILMLAEGKEIGKIPKYRVKTTLQQAIQLLKRNRDIIFENDCKDKPISILISTLGAWNYQNQDDLFDTLVHLIKNMPASIQNKGEEIWVENPVNDRENFAEKWNIHPQRYEKFLDWLSRFEDNLNKLEEYDRIEEAVTLLSTLFGERITVRVIREMKESNFLNSTTRGNVSPVVIKPNKPWGHQIDF